MLNLPQKTLIQKALPKNAIFARFELTSAERKHFNDQISRLTIVAEISSNTTNITPGKKIKAIFVVVVALKSDDCAPRHIAMLAKNIKQNMVFVLSHESKGRLAIAHSGKVFISDPAVLDSLALNISGLDLDHVWNATLATIGNFQWQPGDDIDEVIAKHEQYTKTVKKIAQLEQKARTESQPRRKWTLVEEIRKLRVTSL
jgi:hypothetical protein